MQLRMAMDKLKQMLGMQITDEQLLALLRRDMEIADPGDDTYGMRQSTPIYQDLSEYPADEIAETVREYEEQQRAAGFFDPRMYL